MYLLEKRPGPKGGVRYREVSAIWDVRYKEVLLYLPVSTAREWEPVRNRVTSSRSASSVVCGQGTQLDNEGLIW